MTGIWYRDGKVRIAPGSAEVEGYGTLWNSQTAPGDVFTLDNDRLYMVAEVIDNTHLVIDPPYEGPALSALAQVSAVAITVASGSAPQTDSLTVAGIAVTVTSDTNPTEGEIALALVAAINDTSAPVDASTAAQAGDTSATVTITAHSPGVPIAVFANSPTLSVTTSVPAAQGAGYSIIRNFTGTLSADIAARLAELIQRWQTREDQFADWLAGTATGGPNADGYYPLSDALGAVRMVASPAKLTDFIGDGVARTADEIVALLTDDAAAAAASAAQALAYRNQAQTIVDTFQGDTTTAIEAVAAATVQAGVATTQANLATSAATAVAATQAAAQTTLAAAEALRLATLDDQTAIIAATTAIKAAAQAALAATETARDTAVAGVGAVIAARDATLAYRDATLIARTAAETARDLAQDWASKPTDPVIGGLYSARYYALSAAQTVTDAAATVIIDATAVRTEVLGYVAQAQGYAQTAQQTVIDAAGDIVTQVTVIKNQAVTSAGAAADSVLVGQSTLSSMQTIETSVISKAAEAAGSASLAATKATESGNSAATAIQAAVDAVSAKGDAINARDLTFQARDAGLSYRTLAQAYAENAQGVQVEAGLYSAKHYALLSEGFKNQAALIVGGSNFAIIGDGVAARILATSPGELLHLVPTASVGIAFNALARSATFVVNPAGIEHQSLTGAGTSTHAQIDAHVADGGIHVANSELLATRDQVFSYVAKVSPKILVRLATTANIALTGTPVIDGVQSAVGDAVLAKDQTLAEENGLYTVLDGVWQRHSRMDSWTEVSRTFVWVSAGNLNTDTGWACSADLIGVIGATPIAWQQFAGSGFYPGAAEPPIPGTYPDEAPGIAVTPGQYRTVTVDAYGRVIGGGNPSTLAGYGILNAYAKDEIDLKLSDLAGTTSAALDLRFAELVGTAGAALDTLGEIQTRIESGDSAVAALVSTVGTKANAADVYTKTAIDGFLALKANTVDVYTKTETDSAIAPKANTADVYTKTQIDSALALKATATSVYTKTEIDGSLALKANVADVYTKTAADSLLALKATATSVYTKTETDSAIALKANTADVYTKTATDSAITTALTAYTPPLSNGTASLPSVRIGEATSGFYRLSAGIVGFVANTIEVFRTTAAGCLSFLKAVRGAVVTLADADASPDFNAANYFDWTVSANRALNNPTNLVAGQSGRIVVRFNGAYSVSMGSYWKPAGGASAQTFSSASGKVDSIQYSVVSSTEIHYAVMKAFG